MSDELTAKDTEEVARVKIVAGEERLRAAVWHLMSKDVSAERIQEIVRLAIEDVK